MSRSSSARPEAPAAGASPRFTEHVDLMPTVLEAAGRPVPLQCDGRSLPDFLRGEEPAGWRDAATWEHDFRDLVHPRLRARAGPAQRRLPARRSHRRAPPLRPFRRPAASCLRYRERDPGLHRRPRLDPRGRARGAGQAQAMLTWRMLANERRLTGCALTPQGVVGGYDPR